MIKITTDDIINTKCIITGDKVTVLIIHLKGKVLKIPLDNTMWITTNKMPENTVLIASKEPNDESAERTFIIASSSVEYLHEFARQILTDTFDPNEF
ncbi:MAG: hypothetical protein WC819_03560 [Parcubacteria group bacterium]|jgi:hypothetical protein